MKITKKNHKKWNQNHENGKKIIKNEKKKGKNRSKERQKIKVTKDVFFSPRSGKSATLQSRR